MDKSEERGKGERWKCTDCGHISTEAEMDIVKDPGSDDTWRVCRGCRTPENFDRMCDERYCKKVASSGTPTPTHYAWTCYDHKPTPPKPPQDTQGRG